MGFYVNPSGYRRLLKSFSVDSVRIWGSLTQTTMSRRTGTIIWEDPVHQLWETACFIQDYLNLQVCLIRCDSQKNLHHMFWSNSLKTIELLKRWYSWILVMVWILLWVCVTFSLTRLRLYAANAK